MNARSSFPIFLYVDNDGHLLAHTFTRPFPDSLATANSLDAGGEGNIRLVAFGDRQAIDIAVPVREGIYTLGAVHVGLSKSHIASLVGTLRTTFLGFIPAVTIIMFVIALRLSTAVVGPITRLTRAADAVSRGGLDQATSLLGLDREPPRQCPAYADTDLPCWHFDQSLAEIGVATPEPDRTCRECRFYRRSTGSDEVGRLADSFGNMIWSIRLYRGGCASPRRNTGPFLTATPIRSSWWTWPTAASWMPIPRPSWSTAAAARSWSVA